MVLTKLKLEKEVGIYDGNETDLVHDLNSGPTLE